MQTTKPATSRPKLAIGPANYAGQAHAWTRAVAEYLPADAWSFTRGRVRSGDFLFDADLRIPLSRYYLPLLHHTRMRRLFRRTTHVALDGFQAFYSFYRRGSSPADAVWLNGHGWRSALIAHGSDVRDPASHQARNKWSLFNAGDEAWRRQLTEVTKRNRDAAVDSGLPLFVSTPDLLHDLPTATWLPLTVDLTAWRGGGPILESGVPTVLHLPSRRHPPIKGTQYVDEVCRDLDSRGVIRYLSPESVEHRQMPELVRSADIVVDQLLAASYGVAAVEAMAAGRLVIGYVGEETRALMPEAPPIVNATPDDLGEVLAGLLADRSGSQTRAEQGLPFVERWHSGAAAAEALRPFLGLAQPTSPGLA